MTEALAFALYMTISTFLPNVTTAVVLFYGGHLVLGGSMSAGSLVSFMLYQQSLSSAFQVRKSISAYSVHVRWTCTLCCCPLTSCKELLLHNDPCTLQRQCQDAKTSTECHHTEELHASRCSGRSDIPGSCLSMLFSPAPYNCAIPLQCFYESYTLGFEPPARLLHTRTPASNTLLQTLLRVPKLPLTLFSPHLLCAHVREPTGSIRISFHIG